MTQAPVPKIPQSVLVMIHTPALDVLLIRRTDAEDYWQSVTGSKDTLDEAYGQTAVREVAEETGIDARAPGHVLRDWGLENVYEIYPSWRWRYAPGVVHNTEHLFGLCVPAGTPVRLSPREHTDWIWLPWQEAAERCASPSNAEACLLLPRFASPASATRLVSFGGADSPGTGSATDGVSRGPTPKPRSGRR